MNSKYEYLLADASIQMTKPYRPSNLPISKAPIRNPTHKIHGGSIEIGYSSEGETEFKLVFQGPFVEFVRYTFEHKDAVDIKPESPMPFRKFSLQINTNTNEFPTEMELHFYYDIIPPLQIKISFEDTYVPPIVDIIQPKHQLGDGLVNIIFNVDNTVHRSVISLFMDNSARQKNNPYQLLATYEASKTERFKSIGGLAYGTYGYQISQFDDSGVQIAETAILYFRLEAPNYSGKNRVTIR